MYGEATLPGLQQAARHERVMALTNRKGAVAELGAKRSYLS